MTDNTIKLYIKIHKESFPELYNYIKSIPPRKRAERFKILAYTGLLNISNISTSTQKIESKKEQREEEIKGKLDKMKFLKNTFDL